MWALFRAFFVARHFCQLEEEINMNDNQLNKVLGTVGIEKMVVLDPGPGRRVKPLVDGDINRSKEKKGGTAYPSQLNLATKEMQAFHEEEVLHPLNLKSEKDFNMAEKATELILSGLDKKHFTAEEMNWRTNYVLAKETQRAIQAGKDLTPDAACTVVQYNTAIHLASRPISNWVLDAVADLTEDGQPYKNIDFDSRQEKWIINFAIKTARIMSPEKIDEIAHLQAVKDQVIAEFKHKANRFKLGENELANAYLYAALYLANLEWHNERASKQRSEGFQKRLKDFYAMVTQQEGQQREPNEDEKEKMYADIPPHTYDGFTSISTLFPIGNKEFLTWAKTGKFVAARAESICAGAFFRQDEDFTDEEIAQIKALIGTSVYFNDGALAGTKWAVDAEDRINFKGKEIYLKQSDILKAGYPKAYAEALSTKKFLRSAKIWHGGMQTGTVLFATITPRTFKLWMGGFKTAE